MPHHVLINVGQVCQYPVNCQRLPRECKCGDKPAHTRGHTSTGCSAGDEHAGVSKQVCITPDSYGTTIESSHRHVSLHTSWAFHSNGVEGVWKLRRLHRFCKAHWAGANQTEVSDYGQMVLEIHSCGPTLSMWLRGAAST